MGPIRSGDGGDEVGDAWSVLTYAYAMSTANAGITVRHVGRSLLMHGGDKADARGRENIKRVHIGRTDDPEHIGNAVGH